MNGGNVVELIEATKLMVQHIIAARVNGVPDEEIAARFDMSMEAYRYFCERELKPSVTKVETFKGGAVLITSEPAP